MTGRTTGCALAARVERAFPRGADEALRGHLASCEACMTRWRELERLQALGRALPAPEIAQDRAEAARTALLARAAKSPSRPGRAARRLSVSRWAFAAVVLLAAGAAAASVVALSAGGDAGGRALLTARKGAVAATDDRGRFVELTPLPDEIVLLLDGAVHVAVTPLAPGERFRVVTVDGGEVEVRGTAFVARAAAGHLEAVSVLHGRVEVRPRTASPQLLGRGERWDASPAEVEVASQAPESRSAEAATPPAHVGSTGAPTDDGATSGPTMAGEPLAPDVFVGPPAPEVAAVAPAAGRERRHPRATPAVASRITPPAATPRAPLVPSPRPGEERYQAAWSALRSGDLGGAAAAFAAARDEAGDGPVAEDASFWLAVSQKRSGQTSQSAATLRAYLERYPHGARRDEATAMLAWDLLEKGDVATARNLFEAVKGSRVAAVRESCRRGLEVIEGKESI